MTTHGTPPRELSEPTLLVSDEWRVEGRDKVTGAARFAADHRLAGMLEAVFVASPYSRARIVSVDTAAARAVPGVRAVVTGADVRPARFGRTLLDWPVLCWDQALFVGDRVAAVAADTRDAAEEASRRVVVEYEELPPLLDPEAALAPDAPVLHPEAAAYRYLRGPRRPPVPHPNLQGHGLHEHGDLAAGFARAARVFEHAFDLARTHQGYIEPRACVVWLDGELLRVISTNKAPFALREHLAATLGLPPERIVVDTGYVGGDFGGKGLSLDEFALYFLARASGRPVRSVMRYADDLQATNTRHAARITLRTGVDADGRILAHQARVVFDGGAYAAGKPAAHLMPGEALTTLAGYHVPAARVEAMTVYTNNVPAGHARAPGQPQNAFAAESHIDLIARGLGLDPLALRERNAIRPGQVDVLGAECHGSTVSLVLETLRRESGWDRGPAKGRGRGIGLGVRHVGRGKTSLVVRLERDGEVEVLTAVTDQGGGAHTMIQRVVAAELGLPLGRVAIRRGTTAEAPSDPGVGGSRVTPVAGGAALAGARKLKALLADGRTAPLEVVGEHSYTGHEQGVCAYAVEVEVDRETGALRVADALLVADVGTVINPVALRGQLAGGFIFGLGQALMEELRVEDGRVTTANLGDYKLPTIADAPPLRIVLLTEAKGPGPFGAKSVGELANPGIGATIANAVHDATGARVFSLPITAEKVLGAPLRPVRTPRLDLVPLPVELLAALLAGDRAAASLAAFALPDDWPTSSDQRFLGLRVRQLRDDPAVLPWLLRAIVLRDGRRMIGHVGFHGPPGVNGLRAADAVEIGYTIFPEFRGRGCATEAAAGLIAWAADQGIARVVASVAPANAPSLRVVQKLGFRQIGSQHDDEEGEELVFQRPTVLMIGTTSIN